MSLELATPDLKYMISEYANFKPELRVVDEDFLMVNETIVVLDLNTSYKDFLDLCYKSFPNIIIMKDMKDPDLWLPFYPDKLKLINCFVDKLDPEYPVKTTEIYYSDYNREKHKKSLYINWDKFPCLRKVHIVAYDINEIPEDIKATLDLASRFYR